MRRLLSFLMVIVLMAFLAGSAYAGRWQLVGVPIIFKADVSTMSGDETFDNDDALIFVKDPGGTNRTFNPTSTFIKGILVYLVNTADASETITFDSAGLGAVVGQNECGIFTYDGSVWKTIWLGQNDLTQDGTATFGTVNAFTLGGKLTAGAQEIEGSNFDISGGTIAGITDLAVADGGTGVGSWINGQLLIGNTTGNTAALATLTEGEGIDITNDASSITLKGEDASTTNKGIASFNTNHFSVTTGAVSLLANGIDDTLVDWGAGANQVDLADIPGGTASASAFNFGGATSVEIPNGANPTTDAEGEIAYDTDDEAIEVFDGAASRLIGTVDRFSATIYDPDSIQGTEDAVPILPVEADWAPHGIKLISVGIKTDANSTYAVNFEEWTSPLDGSPSTIEAVTTSASVEAEDDGTLSDSDIAVGSIIYVDLDTDDIDMLVVWGTYYIKPGD